MKLELETEKLKEVLKKINKIDCTRCLLQIKQTGLLFSANTILKTTNTNVKVLCDIPLDLNLDDAALTLYRFNPKVLLQKISKIHDSYLVLDLTTNESKKTKGSLSVKTTQKTVTVPVDVLGTVNETDITYNTVLEVASAKFITLLEGLLPFTIYSNNYTKQHCFLLDFTSGLLVSSDAVKLAAYNMAQDIDFEYTKGNVDHLYLESDLVTVLKKLGSSWGTFKINISVDENSLEIDTLSNCKVYVDYSDGTFLKYSYILDKHVAMYRDNINISSLVDYCIENKGYKLIDKKSKEPLVLYSDGNNLKANFKTIDMEDTTIVSSLLSVPFPKIYLSIVDFLDCLLLFNRAMPVTIEIDKYQGYICITQENFEALLMPIRQNN